MSPRTIVRVLLLLLVVALAGGPAVMLATGHGVADIPVGNGFAALDLCSRVMESGMSAPLVRDRYVAPKVRPLPWFWSVDIEPGHSVTVRTRLPFLAEERTAVYRPGLGCTIVPPDADRAAVNAMPFHPAPSAPPDPRPWPLGEGAAEAERLSPSQRQVLDRRAAEIFSESSADPDHGENATALLVAIGGHLVYERYGQGNTRENPQLGWSMTKTITALLAGVLAGDGKLSLSGPVGLASWQGTPKEQITWRSLLNMAPGLRWDEGYRGASDTTQMLFSRADEGEWAAAHPLVDPPGKRWLYSTGFSNIAMLRLKQLVGGSHQAIYDFYQGRLFAPLHMRGAVIEPDASGTPVGGARGFLRPVDWLRLGQLVEDGGKWEGHPLVPADFVEFMTAASPASPEYGGGLWRLPTKMVPAAVRPRLPEDLVFFCGHMEQLLVVVPSRQLVVLRMGVAQGRGPARQKLFELVADLAAR